MYQLPLPVTVNCWCISCDHITALNTCTQQKQSIVILTTEWLPKLQSAGEQWL